MAINIYTQTVCIKNYYNNSDSEILEKITNMEAMMSQLSDAVERLATSVQEDFAEQVRINTELRGLLDEALATDAADAARIAKLTEQADALQAQSDELQTSIDQTVTQLGEIDLDPAFPGAEPPPAEAPGGGAVNEGEPRQAKRR